MPPAGQPVTTPVAPATADGFASTVWSLILAASKDEDNGPDLNRLCSKYWQPVYVFARRSGLAPADAEDATQDFFAYFLKREWVKQACETRGRFRAFLYTLLRNFLANHRRREGALKRGGTTGSLSLNAELAEVELKALASPDIDPARAYERSWANCLLRAAMERVAEEQSAAGRTATFEALRPLLGRSRAPGDYERAAAQLGMGRGRIAVIIHRLSRRYAELIRIELAETLMEGDDLDGELRHLLAALS